MLSNIVFKNSYNSYNSYNSQKYEYINKYKSKDIADRQRESSNVIIKYPDRVPVIVDTNDNSSFNEKLDKHKFVVPDTLSVSEFVIIIRKRLRIDSSKAIFVFCGNTILIGSMPIRQIYDKYKEEDGFLYLIYKAESTYG